MKPQLNIIAKGKQFDRFTEQPDRENWAVCSVFLKSERIRNKIDKFVQVHPASLCRRECYGCNMLAETPTDKIIVRHYHEEHPDAEMIPSDKLKEMFGNVFFNSVCWQIAYAIYKGYKDITLHGIDMLQRKEYIHQRDGVFFLMGFAKCYGVKINIPPWSGLNIFKKIPYGDN